MRNKRVREPLKKRYRLRDFQRAINSRQMQRDNVINASMVKVFDIIKIISTRAVATYARSARNANRAIKKRFRGEYSQVFAKIIGTFFFDIGETETLTI
jgi:hypothetical protein